MDLFDHNAVHDAVNRLDDAKLPAEDVLHILKRLKFMAYSAGGSEAMSLAPDVFRILARYLPVSDKNLPESRHITARLFTKLTMDDAARTVIIQSDVIQSLIDMLQSDENSLRIRAGYALGKFAPHDDFRAEFLRLNAINLLINMLRSDDHVVKIVARYAFIKLGTHGLHDAQPAIMRSDAAPLLFAMIGMNIDDIGPSMFNTHWPEPPRPRALSAPRRGLNVLPCKSLSSSSVLKPDVTALVKMLGSDEQNAKSRGVHSLRSIALNEDQRYQILELSAIPLLISMLGSNDNDTMSAAATVLGKLSQYDDTRAEILQLNTIISLAGMIETDDHNVRSSAAYVLAELVQHDDSRSRVLRLDIMPTLISQLEIRNDHTRLIVINALGQLSKYDDTRVESLKGVTSIVGMLRSNDNGTMSAAARTLGMLAGYDAARAEILRLNAIHLFIDMLGSNDNDVKSAAIEAVRIFAPHDDGAKAAFDFQSLVAQSGAAAS
jgi:HEAT repeat protein